MVIFTLIGGLFSHLPESLLQVLPTSPVVTRRCQISFTFSGCNKSLPVCTVALFVFKKGVFILPWLTYVLFPHSAAGRRSGETGVLIWPWCCQTSHTPWIWILAQLPPWATHLVGFCQEFSHQERWQQTCTLKLCLHSFCLTPASKGLVDAAHFCYLMAQVGLGVFTKKSTKMVLIGSNHRLMQ